MIASIILNRSTFYRIQLYENMMNKINPTSMIANRQTNELTIQWNDGHASVYSFGLLRAACPCASCRGGHENMRPTPDPEVFTASYDDSPATHMQKMEAVGAYAITIAWEDGHQYGIYNWPYLRMLCPCPVCREGARHGG